jgi:exodeoxyribonuclease VII large subunit
VALESSADEPVPLRTVALKITEWVGRLGRVWVEGQVTQVSRRTGTTFLTLRDPVADVSMTVTAARQVVEGLELRDGARVVCWVKPEVWMGRGSLQLTAFEIRPIGAGALLARLEALKKVLAAEGLFDRSHKQALPFLPRQVGLVTGRASAAARDVVENARRRWPAVSFETREVAVQGPTSVTAVIEALSALDRAGTVDVIVLARGGGSVEDLLPWSDEALCRAVFACRTPVVSAIGHEPDTPLVDFVADVRCSTPTDAGKRVVPDVSEERLRITRARDALARSLSARLDHERRGLDRLQAGPLIEVLIGQHNYVLEGLQHRGFRAVGSRLGQATSEIESLRSRVRALSPLATLERGYALALGPSGAVLRSVSDVSADEAIGIRLADGSIRATVTDVSVQSRP